MKRSFAFLCLAPLALAACSGGEAPPEGEAQQAAAPAPADPNAKPHVNPWAKDAPTQAAAPEAAPAPAPADAKPKQNPWAKDGANAAATGDAAEAEKAPG